MKRYLENIIIAWLRSQPGFTNRSRFDLELLTGDLVRDIEDEVDDYVAQRLVEAEAEADRQFEAEYEMLKAEREGRERQRRSVEALAQGRG
jgi:hypothetical protein